MFALSSAEVVEPHTISLRESVRGRPANVQGKLAEVAKLADASGLGPDEGNLVRVRFSPSAPKSFRFCVRDFLVWANSAPLLNIFKYTKTRYNDDVESFS